MGNVALQIFMTLDGMVDGEGRASLMSWNPRFWSDEMEQYSYERLQASDALLLGRGTYEAFAASWPVRQPVKPKSEWTVFDAYTDRINSLPKHVASNTLRDLSWNADLLEGDVPAAVQRLKRESEERMLVFGGGTFAKTLTNHNLIDQYHIWVFPVAVGAGLPLFGADADRPLQLTSTRQFDTGVIVLTYEPLQAER